MRQCCHVAAGKCGHDFGLQSVAFSLSVDPCLWVKHQKVEGGQRRWGQGEGVCGNGSGGGSFRAHLKAPMTSSRQKPLNS